LPNYCRRLLVDPALKLAAAARLLVVTAVLAMAGCGEPESKPIRDLSDEHKKQLQELNEQRTDEWGRKK
jgi:hypothetical protein